MIRLQPAKKTKNETECLKMNGLRGVCLLSLNKFRNIHSSFQSL